MSEQAADRYQVDTAPNDSQVLRSILRNIAKRPSHVRIVGMVWQAPYTDQSGKAHSACYTIVSEQEAG